MMATKFRKTDKPNNLNWNERKKNCMRTANANNKLGQNVKKNPEQYSCDIVKSKRQKIYLCMNMWFYRQEIKTQKFSEIKDRRIKIKNVHKTNQHSINSVQFHIGGRYCYAANVYFAIFGYWFIICSLIYI